MLSAILIEGRPHSMKQILITLIIFFFGSCSKKQIKNDNIGVVEFVEQKKSDTLQEPNYIAIFDKKTEKNSTLTISELIFVNISIENSVDKYNEDLKIRLEKLNNESKEVKRNYDEEKIDLRNYFRQYVISVNDNGDKIVRVLCFCTYFGNWKTEIMRVHDGGDCYLNGIINLTKNKTEYFGTNGLA